MPKPSIRLPLVLALVACLAACASPSPEPMPETTLDRPHVVVVLIDTFRPDHLAALGYERETAPFLDSVLQNSKVFRRAFSTSSWTAPSTGSLFTSLYPTNHGVTEGFLAHQRRADAMETMQNEVISLNRLPEDVATLPEILQRAGYTTFGVASNINIGKAIGFDRGFDYFEHMQGRSAKRLAEQMIDWHREVDTPGPRFTYMHFNDVHEPYQPREPWYDDTGDDLDRTVSAYNSEISFLDQALETLHRELSWDRQTLLVLVSDHGEEFMEHGQIGHHFTLYNELMKVLMVFSGPDLGITAGLEEGVNVSLVDVVPTILDVLDLPVPDARDGLSLVPFLGAESVSESVDRKFRKRILFAHRSHHRVRQGLPERHLWAAVYGDWKWIDHPDGVKLLDFQNDPGETIDQRPEHEEMATLLEKQLSLFQEGGFRATETTAVEIDEETFKALEALGYVQ